MGARARPLRRDPAARACRPTRTCLRSIRARLRPDLGGVRRARHADQQPQRCRRPDPTPDAQPAMAMFMVELGWFSHRVFWHMVVRRRVRPPPGPQARPHRAVGGLGAARCSTCSTTSTGASATPSTAESHFGARGGQDGHRAAELLLAHNCYAGASFFRPCESPLRHEIGVDHIMWGQDYPHSEGTYPYTTEALRNTFAGVDRRRGRADGRAHRGRGLRLRPRRARARSPNGRPDRRRGRDAARRDPGRLARSPSRRELKPW